MEVILSKINICFQEIPESIPWKHQKKISGTVNYHYFRIYMDLSYFLGDVAEKGEQIHNRPISRQSLILNRLKSVSVKVHNTNHPISKKCPKNNLT
jgi:hypothetical protein